VTDDLRARFEGEALPHLRAVFNVARRLTRRNEDAHDLTQEAFFRAYRKFDTFAPGTNCKAWLFTITYSLFVNRYHRDRRAVDVVSIDEHEQVPDRGASDARHLPTPARTTAAADVETALAGLSEEYRAAILLVDVEELSYEEAAEALGCPVGTIRSRLFRARRHLALSLRDYDIGQRRPR
jgi:RNA polymerase sigma-70 factor (ECF subfamily)